MTITEARKIIDQLEGAHPSALVLSPGPHRGERIPVEFDTTLRANGALVQYEVEALQA